MDGFALGLCLGLLLGGLALYLLLRRRQLTLSDELGEVTERLSEANAALAAAEAESRLLSSQSQQDGSVLKALGPVAERLSEVQRQVALLET